MQLFEYIIEHWETISLIFGGLLTTIFSGYQGGKQGGKAIQKKLDQSQWKGINQNTDNIKQLNSKVDKLETELKQNKTDDIAFRSKSEENQNRMQVTLEAYQERYFKDRDDDKTKTIERLQKKIDKLTEK